MSFCNAHGIPHSQFLDWDPDDRAKALAFVFEDGSKCGMCGTGDWEWSETDEHGVVTPKKSYVPIEHFCMGCYLRSVANENIPSESHGVTVRLVPMKSAEAAKNYVATRRAWEERNG